MTMHDKFQQDSLRERGKAISRVLVSQIERDVGEVDDGVWLYALDDVRNAYRKANLDNYEKVALMAYLVDRNQSRYGSVGEVDDFICGMVLRIL